MYVLCVHVSVFCVCMPVEVRRCICACVCMIFATAPHTLPEGQQYYDYREQEEANFTTHTNVGILKISEPQCLHCVECKIEKCALYRAITLSQYSRTGKMF